MAREFLARSGLASNQSSVPTFRSFIRPPSRTPLKCLLSRSIKGKDLITYQSLVSEDYAQKSGKSRTIANKFGMYWYVACANELPRLHAEHLPGPPGTIEANRSGYRSRRLSWRGSRGSDPARLV